MVSIPQLSGLEGRDDRLSLSAQEPEVITPADASPAVGPGADSQKLDVFVLLPPVLVCSAHISESRFITSSRCSKSCPWNRFQDKARRYQQALRSSQNHGYYSQDSRANHPPGIRRGGTVLVKSCAVALGRTPSHEPVLICSSSCSTCSHGNAFQCSPTGVNGEVTGAWSAIRRRAARRSSDPNA